MTEKLIPRAYCRYAASKKQKVFKVKEYMKSMF